MQTLYATQVASISELKKNPTKLINDAHGMPVVILNHNVAAAYLIPVETFEKLMDAVDDNELKNIIEQRLSAPFTSIKVELDDLWVTFSSPCFKRMEETIEGIAGAI